MADLIDLAGASTMLGISSTIPKRAGNRLWELIHRGTLDIPYLKVGRRIMFDPEDIEAWKARHKVNGNGLRNGKAGRGR